MKKTLFVIFFISLFLISCNENKNVHNALHHAVFYMPSINPRYSERIQMTDFVDSVTHIKLETTDESLIGDISLVLFLDSLLIIQDNQTQSVFFFYKDGRFSHKIDRRGQGPGEYILLGRVMIDTDSQRIMIFDKESRKLIFYNLDGTFIKEITQFGGGAIIRDIINLPDGNFLLYNYDQILTHIHSGLWKVDPSGIYIRTLLPPNTGYPFIANLHQSYFYRLNDGVGLNAGDVNVIYHFRQDTLVAFLSYTIRNRTTAEDIRRRNRRRNINQWDVFDHVGKMISYEVGNYIFTQWGDDFVITSVFSKRDNDVIAIGLPTFRCSRLAVFGGRIVPSNKKNSLIVVFGSSLISLYLEHPRMPSELARDKLLELTYGMSEREIEDMNPIIQILHIRQ